MEIKITGVVREQGYMWSLESIDESYSSDILVGIDEILSLQNEDELCEGDEVELTIKINRNS